MIEKVRIRIQGVGTKRKDGTVAQGHDEPIQQRHVREDLQVLLAPGEEDERGQHRHKD